MSGEQDPLEPLPGTGRRRPTRHTTHGRLDDPKRARRRVKEQPGTRRLTATEPPRLHFNIWSRVKVLLLVNMLPIAAAIWMGWRVYQGEEIRLADGVDPARLIVTLAVLVGSCVVLAVTAWFFMPIAGWLRDYPHWHYKNSNKLLWALPSLLGHVAWFCCALLGLAMAMGAVALIAMGLVELYSQAAEAERQQGAGAPPDNLQDSQGATD